MHVFFPRSQARKEMVLTLTGGRPCEKLMTENGNDSIIELFLSKGRRQWSIKKKQVYENCVTVKSYICSVRLRDPFQRQGSEWTEQKGKDTYCKV